VKPRPPGSIADAVTVIKVAVGEEAMAAAVGKSAGLMRAWCDPDDERKPALPQAILLDCLYRRVTGEAPPLLALFKREVERAHLEHVGGSATGRQVDLRASVLLLQGELGDLSRSVTQAHADGDITTSERATIAKDLRDLVKTANTVLDDISNGHLRKRIKT
jgi:hypothetical protein